jgi:hypothetical protein
VKITVFMATLTENLVRKNNMEKLIYAIILLVIAAACREKMKDKYVYPQNPNLSTLDGQTIDSLTFFFPSTLKYGDSLIPTKLDSFKLNWYSSQLYPSKERILYNYYLEQNVYRLTWLRSFDNPVFITLYKDGQKVWMTVKKLDRQPSFTKTVYKLDFNSPKVKERKHPKFNSDDFKSSTRDSVVLPNRNANLLIDERKELHVKDWEHFEHLLNGCDYWHMTPFEIEPMGFDGSQWIIEASFADKYWFVDRWSPKDCFRNCGEFLIKLSELKEEMY